MWINLPAVRPQLSGNNWLSSAQIILPIETDSLLVKVEFAVSSFANIFSSVWVRVRQNNLAHKPQRFWIDPSSQICRFELARELPAEIKLESKILKRYRSSEPIFDMILSYWVNTP